MLFFKEEAKEEVKWGKREPEDPDVKAAYEKAYKEEKILAAIERGKADAHKPRSKPFYQKLGDVAINITKDMANVRLSDSFYEHEMLGAKRGDTHGKK